MILKVFVKIGSDEPRIISDLIALGNEYEVIPVDDDSYVLSIALGGVISFLAFKDGTIKFYNLGSWGVHTDGSPLFSVDSEVERPAWIRII